MIPWQKLLFDAEGLHKYAKRALAKHGCFTLRVPLEPRDEPVVLPMRSALSGTTDAPCGRY